MLRGVYPPLPHPTHHTPNVDRMTDKCEKITFPQLRYRAVEILILSSQPNVLEVFGHSCSINIFRGQQIIGPPKKKSANKFVQEMFDAAKE